MSRAITDLTYKIMDTAMQGIDKIATRTAEVSGKMEENVSHVKEEVNEEVFDKIAEALFLLW